MQNLIKKSAMIMQESDNVATLIDSADTGEAVTIVDVGRSILFEVTALNPIEEGHKIATRSIPEGENVVKYGFAIGVARLSISKGEHVHVNNLDSQKGRGDKRQ